MSVTINTLISDALIDLGRLSPSETIDSDDLAHGVRVANRLFASWHNLLIPYSTTESFAGTGSASYTMGSAGTASSTRALRIIDAYSNDGTYDRPIDIIDQGRYNRISDKSYSGRPTKLFYDPVYAVGVIYLWRVPSSSYTIYIESLKYLHDTLAVNSTISLGREYEHFVTVSLRNYLAGSFGIQLTPRQEREEIKAEAGIKILNSPNRSVTMELPTMFGGNEQEYNINEGDI